jgi:hypothetical protein
MRSQTPLESTYINADFDLKSATAFDTLHRELETTCLVLDYSQWHDAQWHSTVESSHDDEGDNRTAAMDIMAIISAIHALSPAARAELDACSLCEFNIGFDCGDTWGYVHALPAAVVRAVADVNCSIAVTLYPMRNADGTPKEEGACRKNRRHQTVRRVGFSLLAHSV